MASRSISASRSSTTSNSSTRVGAARRSWPKSVPVEDLTRRSTRPSFAEAFPTTALAALACRASSLTVLRSCEAKGRAGGLMGEAKAGTSRSGRGVAQVRLQRGSRRADAVLAPRDERAPKPLMHSFAFLARSGLSPVAAVNPQARAGGTGPRG